jgi:hypothetical protein
LHIYPGSHSRQISMIAPSGMVDGYPGLELHLLNLFSFKGKLSGFELFIRRPVVL